ncbi:MAG: hypothetical protein ACI85O_001007 [Saprospiraceae bacterium]|jgi:uncharacterized protein YllA (UPF0747 family)
MIDDITLEFKIKEKDNRIHLHAFVHEFETGKSLWTGEQTICDINTDILTEITQNKFIIKRTKDLGAGIFGRDVVDKENNVVVVQYSCLGGRYVIPTEFYKTLNLKNYIGLFDKFIQTLKVVDTG